MKAYRSSKGKSGIIKMTACIVMALLLGFGNLSLTNDSIAGTIEVLAAEDTEYYLNESVSEDKDLDEEIQGNIEDESTDGNVSDEALINEDDLSEENMTEPDLPDQKIIDDTAYTEDITKEEINDNDVTNDVVEEEITNDESVEIESRDETITAAEISVEEDGDEEASTDNIRSSKIKKAGRNNNQSVIKIKTIKLNKTQAVLATKATLKLAVTLAPEGADASELLWKSSNEKVATVDASGKVTAKIYGTATITAYSKSDDSIKAVCKIQTRYYDVNDTSKYYYKPVYWAADKQITRGYDDIYFAPAQNCTRREFSIFLWRYAGKPQAKGSIPFKDVKYASGSDSYKAILWASSKGIIKGYGDGTFKPDAAVNRKDTLIMLYRYIGRPAISGDIIFPDVIKQGYKKTSDTYKAILWGTIIGITNGYSDGNFRPLADCLREHIVTFIYRYDQNKNMMIPSDSVIAGEKKENMTDEEYIWNFLKSWLGEKGAAGMIGNLYTESGLISNNLENYYNVKFKVSDATYTKQVDEGKRDFIDNAGYGLAQWTWYTRKQDLLDYAKTQKASVGELKMQLNYIKADMNKNYGTLITRLRSAKTVKAASDAFMLTYERPFDRSETAKDKRAAIGQMFYDKYVKK